MTQAGLTAIDLQEQELLRRLARYELDGLLKIPVPHLITEVLEQLKELPAILKPYDDRIPNALKPRILPMCRDYDTLREAYAAVRVHSKDKHEMTLLVNGLYLGSALDISCRARRGGSFAPTAIDGEPLAACSIIDLGAVLDKHSFDDLETRAKYRRK